MAQILFWFVFFATLIFGTKPSEFEYDKNYYNNQRDSYRWNEFPVGCVKCSHEVFGNAVNLVWNVGLWMDTMLKTSVILLLHRRKGYLHWNFAPTSNVKAKKEKRKNMRRVKSVWFILIYRAKTKEATLIHNRSKRNIIQLYRISEERIIEWLNWKNDHNTHAKYWSKLGA